MSTDKNESTEVADAETAKGAPPPIVLTVKYAFADYQIGQQIIDTATVNEILAGECAGNVLKVANA
jgi:hypothetical protein